MELNLLLFCLLFTVIPFVRSWVVKPGIDGDLSLLHGKRLGLITNPSGVNYNLVDTIDLLFKNPRMQLVALFAPEHGLRGDKLPGEPFDDYIDPVTGLMVFSLYNKNKIYAPTKQQIEEKNIEMLVLDLQGSAIFHLNREL
jgi:uncharacterized protein YbbC (DUF1343 family)